MLLLPLLLSGCSQHALSLFFDVPPNQENAATVAKTNNPTAESPRRQPRGSQPAVALTQTQAPRPPIESVATWEAAMAMLPKAGSGEVDWTQALRQGIIQPRETIDGSKGTHPLGFGFDFYYAGSDPLLDTYFPHSAHTEWLSCDSCHPEIFPKRGIRITMAGIAAHEHCGVCHGTVAFGPGECARCHTAMAGG